MQRMALGSKELQSKPGCWLLCSATNPHAQLILFADEAEDGSSIGKLLSKQGFWKKVLASKAAPVRGAAYVLVAHTAQQ